MSNDPKNPIIKVIILWNPIGVPRKKIESIVIIIGLRKNRLFASAKGILERET